MFFGKVPTFVLFDGTFGPKNIGFTLFDGTFGAKNICLSLFDGTFGAKNISPSPFDGTFGSKNIGLSLFDGTFGGKNIGPILLRFEEYTRIGVHDVIRVPQLNRQNESQNVVLEEVVANKNCSKFYFSIII